MGCQVSLKQQHSFLAFFSVLGGVLDGQFFFISLVVTEFTVVT